MLTTGIDLVELQRMKKALEHEHFFIRVFGIQEQKELSSKKGTARLQSAAACFAAKEAFSKALGTGFRGFALREVQLIHDPLGKPFFMLSGNAEKIAQQQGLSFSVSVTHTREYAAAVVVAVREGQ